MILEAANLALHQRLHDVSLALKPGTVTAICGPNGAGKSTLLSCLGGLLSPDRGAVLLGGAPLANLSGQERARHLGYLPQSPDLAWDMTVATLTALGRLPWRTSRDRDAAAVAQALQQLDMAAFSDRPVSRLSGGERARAHLARVLAGQPRWLLADEPLANLDLAHAGQLLGLLRELARGGAGVVLVLHDLASAMNCADRVLVLHEGRLVADGAPSDALAEPVLASVWGVDARWLGQPGGRALAISPRG